MELSEGRPSASCCRSWAFDPDQRLIAIAHAFARHSLQPPARMDMNTNARIDSLQLMLTDLRMRNEPIRHKAAFRGCQPEFQALVSRLIDQLERELLEEKQRSREESRTASA